MASLALAFNKRGCTQLVRKPASNYANGKPLGLVKAESGVHL
jgi:hypothetical protein